MKKRFWFIIICLSIISCKKEDEVTCLTCTSADTQSFVLCHEGDGNASVNGENTGISYNIYLSDLQAAGAKCGN